MKRIERIRLYPTTRQEQALRFMLDVTNGQPIYPKTMLAAPAAVASAIQAQSFWRSSPFTLNGEREFSVYTPMTGNDNRYVAVIKLDILAEQLARQSSGETGFVVRSTLGTVALLALSLLTLAFSRNANSIAISASPMKRYSRR